MVVYMKKNFSVTSTCITDHSRQPCDMEYKILEYHQKMKEKLKRRKTDDSLGGLSPPVEGRGESMVPPRHRCLLDCIINHMIGINSRLPLTAYTRSQAHHFRTCLCVVVLKLHASELLKYFNSDGTPKNTELEPIRVKVWPSLTVTLCIVCLQSRPTVTCACSRCCILDV